MQTRHIIMEVEGVWLERDMMILTGTTQRAEMMSVSTVDVLVMLHRIVWLICPRM